MSCHKKRKEKKKKGPGRMPQVKGETDNSDVAQKYSKQNYNILQNFTALVIKTWMPLSASPRFIC